MPKEELCPVHSTSTQPVAVPRADKPINGANAPKEIRSLSPIVSTFAGYVKKEVNCRQNPFDPIERLCYYLHEHLNIIIS